MKVIFNINHKLKANNDIINFIHLQFRVPKSTINGIVFCLVSCTVTDVEKCEGEAMANNRKGKLIFFYEWNIVLKWVSNTESAKKIEGKINIPNLSEENDISEIDVSKMLQKYKRIIFLNLFMNKFMCFCFKI